MSTVDLDSGETSLLSDFGAVAAQTPLCSDSSPLEGIVNDRIANLFSPEFDKVAINIPSDTGTGNDVGFSTSTGDVVDVTKILSAGADAYSAARNDSFPLFDRKGNLVLNEGDDILTVTSTGSVVGTTPIPESDGYGQWVSPDGTYIDVNNKITFSPDDAPVILSPDGTRAVYTNSSQDSGLVGGVVYEWLPDNKVLEEEDNILYISNTLTPSELYENNTDDPSRLAITPASDFYILAATVASDDRTVVFAAQRGTDGVQFFAVPIDGSSRPREVGGPSSVSALNIAFVR